MQPALEPWIVKIGIPGKPCGSLARPRRRDHFGIRQRFVIPFADGGIAIDHVQIFRIGHRENVGDITCLAVADLHADRIGHDKA